MSLVRRSALLIAVYIVGGIVLGLAWGQFAPRADCYAPNGTCLFFAGEMSNIFFEIDSWFAGIAALLGILCALALNRFWLARGFRYQLAAAALAIAASYAAARGVEFLNPLQLPANGNANFRTNYIALGAPSALLVWAFLQQLTFAILGPKP